MPICRLWDRVLNCCNHSNDDDDDDNDSDNDNDNGNDDVDNNSVGPYIWLWYEYFSGKKEHMNVNDMTAFSGLNERHEI